MVPVDYGYEDRLVDRIAVNEAIARRLNPRQRRVLLRYTRYGDTYREIAHREGVSVERVRQLHAKGLHLLRKPLVAEPLKQTTRTEPPPGFDKVAFLRHMRRLIERREQLAEWHRQEGARREREEEQQEFERERAEVARLVAGEQAKKAPPFVPDSAKAPPGSHFSHLPHLGDTLKIKLPQQYYVHNSPSYHPPPLPTPGDLNRIAQTAMMYLMSARPFSADDGTESLGKWCTSVVFTRDGGKVSEAVNSIVRELPAHARLSAYPVEIPNGTIGANATTPYASLRVTMTSDGMKLRFDVTWD